MGGRGLRRGEKGPVREKSQFFVPNLKSDPWSRLHIPFLMSNRQCPRALTQEAGMAAGPLGAAYPKPTMDLHLQTPFLFSGSMCTQSRLTLCDPRDCSPPGSSVYGILQARTRVGCHFLLQGISPTRGFEPTSPMSPALAGGFCTAQPPGKPSAQQVPLKTHPLTLSIPARFTAPSLCCASCPSIIFHITSGKALPSHLCTFNSYSSFEFDMYSIISHFS